MNTREYVEKIIADLQKHKENYVNMLDKAEKTITENIAYYKKENADSKYMQMITAMQLVSIEKEFLEKGCNRDISFAMVQGYMVEMLHKSDNSSKGEYECQKVAKE